MVNRLLIILESNHPCQHNLLFRSGCIIGPHVSFRSSKWEKIKEMSLVPVGEDFPSLLQMPIKFSNDCISQDALDVSLGLKPGEIHLLENLRFYKHEEQMMMNFLQIGKTWTDFYK